MNRKPNPLIVVGALLALVGVIVLVALAGKSDKSGSNGETVKALVASAAVAAGTPSANAGLVVKDLPSSAVPTGALTDPAALSGQVSLRALAAGEVVLPGAFGIAGAATSTGVVLPAGKEGLGIELAFAPGGLRYIVPGNRITVWATPKTNGGPATARAIVQNVLVIATTPGAGTGAATPVVAGPGNLDFLLAVSRGEATTLISAQTSGDSLYFTLADSKRGT